MSLPLYPKKKCVSGVSLYPLDKTSETNEIDLRQEFIDLMDGTASEPQRGHWVLLRRMETSQRCSCWNRVAVGDDRYMNDNRKYDEPDKDCKICDGTGYLYRDELHMVRRRVVTPPPGLGGIEDLVDVGIMHIPYVVYYFRYYVNPTEKDKIIEIELDRCSKPVRPFNRLTYYNITFAEPFRDINGRIEYWRCSSKKEGIPSGGT